MGFLWKTYVRSDQILTLTINIGLPLRQDARDRNRQHTTLSNYYLNHEEFMMSFPSVVTPVCVCVCVLTL